MTKRLDMARNEDGVAMIIAIILLFVLLGLGAALLTTAGSQQREAYNQQQSETAYSLAEAALNAQVFALSQEWPTKSDAPGTSSPDYGYPTSCNAASNGTSYCPTATDMSTAYPTSGTCPSGTRGDAWSSSSTVSNGWTTYVRDASASPSLFSDSAEENAVPYDTTATGSTPGSVWVRAVGIVNCHIAVLVTKVSEQVEGVSFPDYVLNANNFDIPTGKSGKDIINTEDGSGNKSDISLRCTGSTYGNGAQPPNSSCASYGNTNQIQPSTVWASPPSATPTLSTSALNEVKELAMANGTYYAANSCNFSNPTDTGASLGGLTGTVVYVTGPCTISLNAVNIGAYNSSTNTCGSYTFLVVASGSVTLGGNTDFCGVIYVPNLSSATGDLVTLKGDSTIFGGVNVDGAASLQAGDSGNGADCTDTDSSQKCGDLEFNLAAFFNIDGFAGADPTPNSFRQLPDTQ